MFLWAPSKRLKVLKHLDKFSQLQIPVDRFNFFLNFKMLLLNPIYHLQDHVYNTPEQNKKVTRIG